MTATREHLAGLELAIAELIKVGVKRGSLPHMVLTNLADEAQSAPEPVQGEAVACWIKSSVPGADIVVLGNPADIHQAATDTKIPLYTSAAKPDAELVELLRIAEAELLDWRTSFPDADSTYTDNLRSRIDAKLAELTK